MITISAMISQMSSFVKYSFTDVLRAIIIMSAAPVESAELRNKSGRIEEFQSGLVPTSVVLRIALLEEFDAFRLMLLCCFLRCLVQAKLPCPNG